MVKHFIFAFVFVFVSVSPYMQAGEVTEDIKVLKEMMNATRLNAILNSKYGFKIYSEEQENIISKISDEYFVDTQWVETEDEANPILDITLYMRIYRYRTDLVGKTLLIMQVIKNMCKDIIGENIVDNRLRIVCKLHHSIIEDYHTIFICENNELTYYPFPFDSSIHDSGSSGD